MHQRSNVHGLDVPIAQGHAELEVIGYDAPRTAPAQINQISSC